MERTLIIIKPDGVQRGLVGPIIERFERRGVRLVGLKLVQVSKELARKHYEAHEGKPFFNGLIEYITSAPVIVMALALAFGIGRFVAAGATFLVGAGIAAYGSIGVPVACTAFAFVLGLILVRFAVETRGTTLPD